MSKEDNLGERNKLYLTLHRVDSLLWEDWSEVEGRMCLWNKEQEV